MAAASISRSLTKFRTPSCSSLSSHRIPTLFSSSYSNSAAALSSAEPQSSPAFVPQDQGKSSLFIYYLDKILLWICCDDLIRCLVAEKGRGGGSRWSKWLLFLPGAITFGLGTWQVFRRQDKVNFPCSCNYRCSDSLCFF